MGKWFMRNSDLAKEWLKKAQSNLAKAKAGRSSRAILYEDLAYDCQQAAEKSLKALLAHRGTEFPKTHSINLLLDIVKSKNISIPAGIRQSSVLTEYAVETRYPGDYEPVKRGEYLKALKLAVAIVDWVEKKMQTTDIFEK
jgi:HEPN domain-containing protein